MSVAPTGGSGSGGSPASELDGSQWHRLHPLSPLVRAGRHLFGLVVLLVILLFANTRGQGANVLPDVVLFGVALVAGVVSWLVTRWRVIEGTLWVETGLLRRESHRFPLSQVQAIDVVQTGLARVLGLAELRLRMAGGGGPAGRLASLRKADAERLRQQLLALSRTVPVAPPTGAEIVRSSDTTGAPAGPPGRLLFTMGTGRLIGSQLLTLSGLLTAALVALAALAASAGSPVASALLVLALAAVLGHWRRFNGQYGMTLYTDPQGLRLQSGLVQTTAETIRTGRVQALRVVEPLLWRSLGWARLEVDVAGKRARRENDVEQGRLRVLVPAGTRREILAVLDDLAPRRPDADLPPPPVARWKAPLRFHFLGFGHDQRYVVASDGRLRRTVTWVPLSKVQSFRAVEGPVQRRLGLSTLKLDAAGRSVAAGVVDRRREEVATQLRRLPELARRARAETRRWGG